MGQLIIRHAGDVTEVGQFRLTRTGLEVEGEPSFDDWKRCGEFLQRSAGAVQWWVGDWLNYGERKWGEMYTQAIEATGLDYRLQAGQWRKCELWDVATATVRN